jgi:hypothetical protein
MREGALYSPDYSHALIIDHMCLETRSVWAPSLVNSNIATGPEAT